MEQNLIFKSPKADYRVNAKMLYSKAFKLAFPFNPANNAVTRFGQYVNGYICNDKPLSLAGNNIELYINFAGVGNTSSNSTIIFDVADSILERRIKVEVITSERGVAFNMLKVSYIDSTGTKWANVKSTQTKNAGYGIYRVLINTTTRALICYYYTIEASGLVFDSSEESSVFWETGSNETVYSNIDTYPGGATISVIDGITIGKTTNVDTNISKCAQLCWARLSIDDVDKVVIGETEQDGKILYDWVSGKKFISYATSINLASQTNTLTYRAINKLNEDLL